MATLLSLRLPTFNPIRASSSASTITTEPPSQTLEQRFGRQGVKFNESGDTPTVLLSVRNGSSLKLRLSDGLVTSYRPKVYWKDEGFEEVLYTVSGEGNQVKGGIGLILNNLSKLDANGSPWRASEWAVTDTDSDSIDAVQVELSCTNGDKNLDISYVVTLYPISMATAVVVKNNSKKNVELTSAMLSHIKFKSRRGTAVQGLRGCSYSNQPPPPSTFGIMSAKDAMEPEPAGWFSFLDSGDEDVKPGSWTVEENLYTILRGKTSRFYGAPPEERLKRIYNTPPSKYETIDQGSGLGFRVIRLGYDDIYLSSPGSFSEKYGKDYFICTGPASMLVPVVLKPGEEWKGAQVIEHDNL